MKTLTRNTIVLSVLGVVLAAVGALLVFVIAPSTSVKLVLILVGLVVMGLGVFFLLAIIPMRKEHRDLALRPFDPQTFQGSREVFEVASKLRTNLAETPYQVLAAPDGLRIEWNLGDVRYRSLLQSNRVQRVYRTTLTQAGNRFIKRDDVMRWDSTVGAFRMAASGSQTSGLAVTTESRKEISWTPEAGVEKPVDFAVNTMFAAKAARAAVKDAGLSLAWPMEAKIGIVAALIAIVGTVAALVVNFVPGLTP